MCNYFLNELDPISYSFMDGIWDSRVWRLQRIVFWVQLKTHTDEYG